MRLRPLFTALIGVINVWNRIAVGLNYPMPRAA